MEVEMPAQVAGLEQMTIKRSTNSVKSGVVG